MGGLSNPRGGGGHVHTYLDTPETQDRIRKLQEECAALRARPVEIRQVEKIVHKENSDLLKNYNDVMRELGELKRSQSGAPAVFIQSRAPELSLIAGGKKKYGEIVISGAFLAGLLSGYLLMTF